MSKPTKRRQRATPASRGRSRRPSAESEFYKRPPADAATSVPADTLEPGEHYRREKARRVNRQRPTDHPLEQARRAYQALLESEAARARGGRPRKVVGGAKRPRPAIETDTENGDE